jgi:hypothetical protein
MFWIIINFYLIKILNPLDSLINFFILFHLPSSLASLTLIFVFQNNFIFKFIPKINFLHFVFPLINLIYFYLYRCLILSKILNPKIFIKYLNNLLLLFLHSISLVNLFIIQNHLNVWILDLIISKIKNIL